MTYTNILLHSLRDRSFVSGVTKKKSHTHKLDAKEGEMYKGMKEGDVREVGDLREGGSVRQGGKCE